MALYLQLEKKHKMITRLVRIYKVHTSKINNELKLSEVV